MKIISIRLDRMRLALDPPFDAAWDPVPRRYFDATLVRVETDAGITGYGSGDTMDGFEAFADLFIGKDPLRIANQVRVLETVSFHAGRYWPLEAALWDIIGKACGQPVATLFGGAADRLPAYASFGELEEPGRARRRGAGRAGGRVPGGEDPDRPRGRGWSGLAAVRAAREAAGSDLAHHGRPESVVADGRRHLAGARRRCGPPDRSRACRPRRYLA